MKRIISLIGAGLGALLLLLVIGGLLLPSSVHVERSTTIDATACNIFPFVNSFARFPEFSPWDARDPNMSRTLSGPAEGKGAHYAWSSDNPDVGVGSQEITASVPCSSVVTALDFGANGEATAAWTLQAKGPSTTVTWGMDSDFGYNLMGRYFGLAFDGMIGPDYEQGLANLKALTEALPKADIGKLEAEVVEVAGKPVFALDTRSASDDPASEDTATTAALEAAHTRIEAALTVNGLVAAGAPMAVTTAHDQDAWVFTAMVPYSGTPPDTFAGELRMTTSPGGKALKVVHRGPWSTIGETHQKIDAYEAIYKLERSGSVWEEFISDPATTASDKLVTHIFIPLR